MRRIKHTKYEKDIEDRLLKGEYVDGSKEEFEEIAATLAAHRKDAVLNIRINSQDLKNLRHKAQQLGVKYQTFIAEILHRAAKT
jgi:predicted DNA binding CopG/RHH family protein